MSLHVCFPSTSLCTTAIRQYRNSSWNRFMRLKFASCISGNITQRIILVIYSWLSYWSLRCTINDLVITVLCSTEFVVLIFWLVFTVVTAVVIRVRTVVVLSIQSYEIPSAGLHYVLDIQVDKRSTLNKWVTTCDSILEVLLLLYNQIGHCITRWPLSENIPCSGKVRRRLDSFYYDVPFFIQLDHFHCGRFESSYS